MERILQYKVQMRNFWGIQKSGVRIQNYFPILNNVFCILNSFGAFMKDRV